MSFRPSLTRILALIAFAPSMFAATFVVPTDRDLVRRAHGIVIATAMPSYAREGTDTAIETVTPMQIEETIKGRFDSTIDVVEPGGTFGGTSMVISGVPRFEAGQRMLLFLANTGKDRWAVTELVLGKFTFVTADNGEELLARDAHEITGWDPNLKPHVERPRAADRFLDFVRTEAKGGMAQTDYFTSATSTTSPTSTTALKPAIMATYSATSYTMVVSGSMGSRWTVFPSPVNWYTGTTTEPGAPNGGVTAAQAGIAAWDNDCPSNVNYVYAGVDNGTHTQGLHSPDGANTILFERDLSTWGVSPFSCSSSGYSGTLGIGGVTSASGTNSLNGETFATTQEADVEMNRGLANCTLLFSNGDFNSAVTHELGHTLGFRHSDQTRSGSAACSTDTTLECSSSAIMTAFVTSGLNGALTAWDQHAVDALYPGGSCTTCTPPSITSQPGSVSTSGTSVTLSVGATGTGPLSYQWYVGTSGNTGSPISGATSSSVTVAPGTTTSYWVRVSNSCGAVNSATATVTVSASTGGAKMKVSTSDFNGDNKSDVFWRNQNATGQDAIWLMNGATKAALGITDTVATDWKPVGIGDFDGDGKADVFWRNSTTGQNAMWIMNGTTHAPSVAINSVGTQWDVAGVGDFDGDGKADIFWRNHSTGENSIWLMNGTTVRVAVATDTVSLAWKVAAIGDFNGDGNADVFWRNPSTGENAMWIMSGTTHAPSASVDSAPTQWDVVGAGDFDGDGKWDIFLRNHNTGENSIWLMNGTVRSVGALTDTVSLAWTPVAFGDYNGDGKSDVFWRNLSTGDNAMWIMNGLTSHVVSSVEAVDPAYFVMR